MRVDITKVANLVVYMLDSEVTKLNDRKLSIMIFMMDYIHNDKYGNKIFNDDYIKDSRMPKALDLGEIFDTIISNIDLDEDDEMFFIIGELLDYVDIDLIANRDYTEFKFTKRDEEFDESLFSSSELEVIKEIVSKFRFDSVRSISNATFKIEKLRNTKKGDIII